MRLLLIAADRMEFTGLIARAGLVGQAVPPAFRPGLAPCPGRRNRLAHRFIGSGACVRQPRGPACRERYGPSPRRRGVDAALAVFQPEAVVSTGFCGALGPRLRHRRHLSSPLTIHASGRAFPALPVSSAIALHSGPVMLLRPSSPARREKKPTCAPPAHAPWKWRPPAWPPAPASAAFRSIASRRHRPGGRDSGEPISTLACAPTAISIQWQ